MSVDQTPDAPHYDPLLDERPRRKKKLNPGIVVGIILSVVVHAALFFYLWKAKFHPHYQTYEDTAVKVDLVKPAPPPPPPPPPPVPQPNVTPPPPAPVVAVEKPVHVESEAPRQVAPPVVAPPPPVAPPVITRANWLSQPNGDDYAEYYPERAQRMEKEGHATMECKVTVKGALTECHILSEDPPGYDFGAQTLKLARFFKMKPAVRDGVPVEGTTIIPIGWKLN
jgi:protein TonB